MGQWATRTRRGGTQSLNMMVSAVKTSDMDVDVTYLNNVSATDFNGTDFEGLPSSFESVTVSQLSARVITVTFQDDITTDTTLKYNGLVPQVLTAQQITMN